MGRLNEKEARIVDIKNLKNFLAHMVEYYDQYRYKKIITFEDDEKCETLFILYNENSPMYEYQIQIKQIK